MEGVVISVGSRIQAHMTLGQKQYACVDECLYLYIFIRIAVSCVGAWDYKMFWQINIQEVVFECFVHANLYFLYCMKVDKIWLINIK